MVVTFLALHMMKSAQPALLYLVPCTILPTVISAWYRGHLYAIWNGVRVSGIIFKVTPNLLLPQRPSLRHHVAHLLNTK